MRLGEFFSWLAIADLTEQDTSAVKAMLEEVLEELPDCQRFDSLADALEEHLENPYFAPSQLNSLLTRFSNLAPSEASPELTVEESIETIASGLTEAQLDSEKLRLFEEVLHGLEEDATEGRRRALQLSLAELESHFRTVWNDYRSIPLTPEEVTAEAVAGHCMLEEAFELWFAALDHAAHNEYELAWEEACSGNRLLVAVSCWSDGLRPITSATIASA